MRTPAPPSGSGEERVAHDTHSWSDNRESPGAGDVARGPKDGGSCPWQHLAAERQRNLRKTRWRAFDAVAIRSRASSGQSSPIGMMELLLKILCMETLI